MGLRVSTAIADVTDAVEKLRADSAVVLDAGTLLGDVEQALGAIHMLQAFVVRRMRAAIEVDATAELTGRSPKRWLAEDQLLASGEAGRLVRLARELPHAPNTEAALDSGEISLAHASSVLTALATLPPSLRETVEPNLTDRARTCPPEEIAGFTDQLLDALGLDKASEERRERRHASRGVDLSHTIGGMWSINGTLTPEAGAKLQAALHAAGTAPGASDGDVRTPRQRRHDALAAVADGYSASLDSPPTNGAPRSVIVTIDLATLEERLEQQPGTLPDGIRVGPATARRLACDAALIPAVLGGKSEILDIGQAGHEFSVAVRRAAYLRDKGRCAFPQCRNRVQELHHIVFRRNRGPDTLDNAAWLCNFHHYLAHEGGWTLVRDEAGNYSWTNKFGMTVVRRLDDG